MKRKQFITSLAGISALTLFGRKAHGLEYYPNNSTISCAVLYCTWCGSARDAGVWISEGMGGTANVFDVKEKPDLSSYQNIIVGTSIHGGKGSEEFEKYIRKYRLSNRIIAYYAVCGNKGNIPGDDQKKKYIDEYLSELCETKQLPGKVFGGRITQGLLSDETNELLLNAHKKWGQPYINFDNLSRSECLKFGEEILSKQLK